MPREDQNAEPPYKTQGGLIRTHPMWRREQPSEGEALLCQVASKGITPCLAGCLQPPNGPVERRRRNGFELPAPIGC